MELSALFPVLGTLAAALVAGTIARANLIVSKESKISEFRHADTGALRDELAAFLASARTMARAAQEARLAVGGINTKFHISAEKITEIRHEAAETFSKIRLRLDQGKHEQNALLDSLNTLIAEQNKYLSGQHDDIELIFNALNTASEKAAQVLRSEWTAVKIGELQYRNAVNVATAMLITGGVLIVVLLAMVLVNEKTEIKDNTNQVGAAGAAAKKIGAGR
jgi:uncharacterized coiled-coil protein SlyX